METITTPQDHYDEKMKKKMEPKNPMKHVLVLSKHFTININIQLLDIYFYKGDT